MSGVPFTILVMDCFILKFNYSIAMISRPVTQYFRWGRIKVLYNIIRIFKGTKYVIILFNVPIILKHLFGMVMV